MVGSVSLEHCARLAQHWEDTAKAVCVASLKARLRRFVRVVRHKLIATKSLAKSLGWKMIFGKKHHIAAMFFNF